MNRRRMWLETLRRQAQLVQARMEHSVVRRRAVGEPPPPHSPNEPAATPRTSANSGTRAARQSRRSRQPSLLTALAHAEEHNQATVAQVWWLYRHHFLRAKQLDVNQRRGGGGDGVDAAVDESVNIHRRADAPFTDEED